MQVKIFQVIVNGTHQDSPKYGESEINMWLKDNSSKIEVFQITQSPNGDSRGTVISIFYKEK